MTTKMISSMSDDSIGAAISTTRRMTVTIIIQNSSKSSNDDEQQQCDITRCDHRRWGEQQQHRKEQSKTMGFHSLLARPQPQRRQIRCNTMISMLSSLFYIYCCFCCTSAGAFVSSSSSSGTIGNQVQYRRLNNHDISTLMKHNNNMYYSKKSINNNKLVGQNGSPFYNNRGRNEIMRRIRGGGGDDRGTAIDGSSSGDSTDTSNNDDERMEIMSDSVVTTTTATPKKITAFTQKIQKAIMNQENRKTIVIASVSTIVAIFLYTQRLIWMPYMDKKFIQEKALSILNSLRPEDPTDTVAWIRAMMLYSSGMAVWEVLGMSTIPVETAAGVVFGFTKGATASLLGKLVGACFAFGAGRTFLSTWITQSSMLQNNAVFQLLNNNNDKSSQQKNVRSPLQTAFLMKFSCFPEFIKNFGSSVLPVIRPWMFFVATFVHGGTFTLLWTWLGVDTAARIAQPTLPVNRKLQVALVVAGFLGLVVTPAVMAWWIRDLKQSVSGSSSISGGSATAKSTTTTVNTPTVESSSQD